MNVAQWLLENVGLYNSLVPIPRIEELAPGDVCQLITGAYVLVGDRIETDEGCPLIDLDQNEIILVYRMILVDKATHP